ncbi:hypothetical protein L9F63_013239, partial [Diploptera punctata]
HVLHPSRRTSGSSGTTHAYGNSKVVFTLDRYIIGITSTLALQSKTEIYLFRLLDCYILANT